MYKVRSPQELWPNLFGQQKLRRCTGNLWGMNSGGGRFYAANRGNLTLAQKLDLLKENGILFVEAHDTDILPNGSYAAHLNEQEKMGVLRKAVATFKNLLTERGMTCAMFTMNLFNSDALFNKGNFSSECEEARTLAISRTKDGLQIAQLLGCVYVYWNGTDGVDGQCGAHHAKRARLFYDAIVEILSWHHQTHGKMAVPFAAEAKVEEPKYKMYNGTAAAFLALCWRLRAEHPDFAHLFGLNIEIAHSVMCKSDPAMDFGMALEAGCLFHVHINGQGDVAFDRDLAPAHVELFDCVYELLLGDYGGFMGIDVQPLPTDTDEQACATIVRTARRIRWAVEKAEAADHEKMASLRAAHNQAGIEEYLDAHLFGICV